MNVELIGVLALVGASVLLALYTLISVIRWSRKAKKLLTEIQSAVSQYGMEIGANDLPLYGVTPPGGRGIVYNLRTGSPAPSPKESSKLGDILKDMDLL